jgi:hypothetical protein
MLFSFVSVVMSMLLNASALNHRNQLIIEQKIAKKRGLA